VSKTQNLSPQEIWQRAVLTEALHGADAAVPLYKQILARNQNHPAANFAIGRILLSRDDFNAIPMIKHAMELNSDYVPAGCVLIQELLWQHGREDNAEAYQRKAKEPKGLSRWRPRTTAGC
jgi:lipopolysaccharide biosynthesis regulator YciM